MEIKHWTEWIKNGQRKIDADSVTRCCHLCEWLRMTEVWHLKSSRIWYMSEGRGWCRDKLHLKIIEKFYLTITFYFCVMWIIPVWAECAFKQLFVAVHKSDVFLKFFDDPSTLLTFVFWRLGCRGRVVYLSDSPPMSKILIIGKWSRSCAFFQCKPIARLSHTGPEN